MANQILELMSALKLLKKNNTIGLIYSLIFCAFFQNTETFAQNNMTPIVEKKRTLRIMFYNCENFFDTDDDSLKNDGEFLPEGDKHWTISKFYDKQDKVSKVITAIGGWYPPEIVGLCEIENQHVLESLVYKSPLYQSEYKIIHQESPDKRGIDVALLYQPKKFIPVKTCFFKVTFPNSDTKTRDILYCSGITQKNDTLHIFVNHWPSRWGGQLESEYKRVWVASIVKQKVDSIFKRQLHANIIIMGDLNDYPENKSVREILQAHLNTDTVTNNCLYDLTHIKYANAKIKTHKHQGKWGILDHIIVSGNLLSPQAKLKTRPQDVYIYQAPYLLEPDQTYLGVQPFRTYIGFKFHGGFSDHLPVFIDLNY